jgi:hypothetical protein
MRPRNPVAEVVARIALAWMDNRPFSEEGRARREAKRAAKQERRRQKRMGQQGTVVASDGREITSEAPIVVMPDGRVIPREEPMIPARVSSKIAVGNGVLAAFPAVELLQWVQAVEFSTPWLESLTNSDYFIYYGSLAISYVIARLTKTPAAGGKI